MPVEDESSLVGWMLAGVAAVISTLTTGVAHLYRKQVTSYEADIKEHKEEIQALKELVHDCEVDRTEIKKQNAVMEERLAWVEKQVCQIQKERTGEKK